MNEQLEFDDMELKEIPVKLKGELAYILREASGDAARKYRNAAIRCAKYADGKMSGMDGIGDIEAYLVSLCLYNVVDGHAKALVPEQVIRGWPSRMVKELFAKIKEISELDETETVESLEKRMAEDAAKLAKLKAPTGDPSKNEQAATLDG